MNALRIPAGSAVLLGRPARPMPPVLADAIGRFVCEIEGVREAYLPQCYVAGVVEPPAQILVLVADTTTNHEALLDAVGLGLKRLLPQEMNLDVWLMVDQNKLLSKVRDTRTHIHCTPPPPKKSWWRKFL